MSSLNTKKRKANRKPGWEKAQAAHDKWLMDKGCHPSQLGKRKREFVEYVPPKPTYRDTEKYPSISTSDTIEYVPTKKQANVYSGDYIIGIATMHKSNLVPVGRGQDPKDLAKMRR
jgi:hypothetical protein